MNHLLPGGAVPPAAALIRMVSSGWGLPSKLSKQLPSMDQRRPLAEAGQGWPLGPQPSMRCPCGTSIPVFWDAHASFTSRRCGAPGGGADQDGVVRLRLPVLRASLERRPWGAALEGGALGVVLALAVAVAGAGGEFIYFQF